MLSASRPAHHEERDVPMTIPRFGTVFLAVALFAAVQPAAAQTLGPFQWQLQPFCNVLVLTVTQLGAVYSVTGYDDNCGASRRIPVTGVAVPNLDGTIEFGLTLIDARGNTPSHLEAQMVLNTLGGTWHDDGGLSGPFVFGAAAPGAPRPAATANVTGFGVQTNINGRRANGSFSAPGATPPGNILTLGAMGYAGSGWTPARASIQMFASETWDATGQGTGMSFFTTTNGTAVAAQRMTILNNGNVGIGVTTPQERLHVGGDVRMSCLKDFNGNGIAGTCLSDGRFKRDVVPFGPALGAVAALRPVQYSWRAGDFPERGFGGARVRGLIAQEVEAVLPTMVVTGADGYKAVDYSQLPLLVVQAIKELKQENDALKARLDALERALRPSTAAPQ
jgi:hypothetical protein